MPFSQSSQITSIVRYIEKINPASLLDVGTGMGQYGFLSRINLENVNLFKIEDGRGFQRPKREWRVRIDGIEGFREYITPVHEWCYDDIMIGDARRLLPSIPDDTYEMVIAVDILEHFTKQDGFEFLNQIRRIASRSVLVSTPKSFVAQEVEANPYENHRSVWGLDELQRYGFDTVIDNDESWIVCS